MELDFTALNNIGLQQAIQDFTDGTAALAIEMPVEIETTPEKPAEAPQGANISKVAETRLQRQQEELERAREVYRKYLQNIKRSETLQIDILKGVRAGQDIYSLFLQAAEAIALMTSNTVFYSQIEKDIRAIHGEALGAAFPLEKEAQEVQRRLDRLKKAAGEEIPPDDKRRIEAAIAAHKGRLSYLQAKLERA